MSSDDVNGPYGSAGGRGADGKYPDPEGWAKDGFWRDPSIDSDYETGLNGAVRPVGSDQSGKGDVGYSYWSDGKGWENSPGSGGTPGMVGTAGVAGNGSGTRDSAGAGGAYATRMDSYATRADYGARAGGANGPAMYGAGAAAPTAAPTATYGTGQAPAGYRDGRPAPGPGRRGTKGGGPGGPGRSGGKVKGSWWRHWTWKKALAIVGSAFAVFLLLVVGAYYYEYNSTPIPTQPVADIMFQNSTVYYSDGTTAIGTFGTIHRQILAYNQIPKVVQDAVVAAEDRGFWTEGGISPTGILRAAYDDLTSSGGSLSGGSTITQQFVRNYYQDIGTSQTASRKIKEIFVAMKLAKEKSKPWILTNYLNTIYLGTGAYGVAAAAETYFHQPVTKLTVAQAAVIAAIIQQPTNYPQPQYRPELEARWHYVLSGMVTMGDLTQQQADAMTFPSMYDTPEQSFGSDPWDPYVMNVVMNELEGVEHITLDKLDTTGYKIVTTVSRSMEKELYSAVNQNVKLIRQEGYTLPSYAMIGAELQNPSTGAIVAMYPGRGQNMPAKQCKIYDCDLNTAVYAREQVGSSFKPYVLATAVNEGMNVRTSILNASPELWVPPDTYPMMLSATSAAKAMPSAYPVHNDGYETIGGAGGATTVQNGLAQSSNTAFTDLAHRATTESIIQMAGQFGVNLEPYASGGSGLPSYRGEVGMALGIAPMTVNEQATMMSAIDNGGTYHSAHVIKSYQAPGGPVVPGMVTQHVVLSQALDSQVQYAMEATTVDGTGTAAAMTDGRPIIGKTGTTTNSKSAFFLGAIPQYSLAVGIFTQSQNPNSPETLTALGGGGFGGTWPAAIWHTFAEAEFAQLPQEQFLSPVFTGSKWNQVGNIPKKKKKPKKHGAPTPTPPGHGHHGHNPFPTPTPTFTFGTPTPTASPSVTPTSTVTATPTATATATGQGKGGGGGGAAPAARVNGVQAGLTLGGTFSLLPGSLLWARASRRRRRRRPGTVG